MSGGEPSNFISLNENPENCHTGNSCHEYTVKNGAGWNGLIYWPLICGQTGSPEAWELVKSGECFVNPIQEGEFNQITKLSFWAKSPNGAKIQFGLGLPDVIPSPGKKKTITLTPTWEKHEFDLSQSRMNLNEVIAGFVWISKDSLNPSEGAIFTIDDIQFEGN